VNPTLFERDEYKFGSIANPDPKVREQAVRHMLDSIRIMREVGSRILSVWAADGTNHPGQDDFRARKHRITESLRRAHRELDAGMRMLVEYKFFEPAFYSTDIADWGQAYVFCKACGPRARVLVDLGHHPQGTNIEQIVAFLIDEGMLGGFHFNCRKYADDDLTVGSLNPYELFLIFHELVSAARGGGIYEVPYMIDQSHNVEPKIEAMIQSVMNLQEAYAKALLVDRAGLARAQKRGDVLEAERVLRRAFAADVTAVLAEMRKEMGLDPDPCAAYRRSGYQRRIEEERG
jgi:L-rhamnose isomerase/sugar isomerase